MTESPRIIPQRAYSYVRMSTDVQRKGDSLRRQVEQSRNYAAEHGLELVEDFKLEDIGVSAFKGANLIGGALGSFLQAVRAGAIDKGSFLLVESLDRITRQEVMKSLTLFIDILNSGVNIVTLADGYRYEAGKTDLPQLMMSLIIMSRAHEESQIKSHRLSAAWANKRRSAAHRKLTVWCPAWLQLSTDRSHFSVIEDRVTIVQSIFEDCAAGIGNFSIARRLNEARVPPFSISNGWHESYVQKILANRAVLGEFQPHRRVDGKRVPDGPAVLDYYPAVIDESLFYRAQLARAQRRVNGGGRKGAFISNLFSGLAECAYCGARMHFMDKGPGPKGGTYLICDNARRGISCERLTWRYDHFEASFLAFVQEIDLEPLFRGDDEARRRAALDDVIRTLEGRKADLEHRRDVTYELITSQTSASEYLRTRLEECDRDLRAVESEIRHNEAEILSLHSAVSRFYESKEQIKSLITRLQRRDNEEVYKLRSQVASRLKSLISGIEVAVAGQAPLTRGTIDLLEKEMSADAGDKALARDMIQQLQEELTSGRADQRYFTVTFKDGSMRGVRPHKDDPLRFESQIYTTDAGIHRIGFSGDDSLIQRHDDETEFSPDAMVQFARS